MRSQLRALVLLGLASTLTLAAPTATDSSKDLRGGSALFARADNQDEWIRLPRPVAGHDNVFTAGGSGLTTSNAGPFPPAANNPSQALPPAEGQPPNLPAAPPAAGESSGAAGSPELPPRPGVVRDFFQSVSNLGTELIGSGKKNKPDPLPRPEVTSNRGSGFRIGNVDRASPLSFWQEPRVVTGLTRVRYISEINRAVKLLTPSPLLKIVKYKRTFRVQRGRVYRVTVTSPHDPIQEVVVRTSKWRVFSKRKPALTVIGVDTKVPKEVTEVQKKAVQAQRKAAKSQTKPTEQIPGPPPKKPLGPYQQVIEAQEKVINAQKEIAEQLGVQGLALQFYFFAKDETYVNIKVHLPGWFGKPEAGLIEVDVYDSMEGRDMNSAPAPNADGRPAQDAGGSRAQVAGGRPAQDASGSPAQDVGGSPAQNFGGSPAQDDDGESAQDDDGESDHDAGDNPFLDASGDRPLWT